MEVICLHIISIIIMTLFKNLLKFTPVIFLSLLICSCDSDEVPKAPENPNVLFMRGRFSQQ